MQVTPTPVRFSKDEMQAIDEARKANKETRSAYIRRMVFAAPSGSSSPDDLRLRLANLERTIIAIRDDDLRTIKSNQRLHINYDGRMFSWIFRFILHNLNLRDFTKSQIEEISKEYEVPGKSKKVEFWTYLFEECKANAQGKK